MAAPQDPIAPKSADQEGQRNPRPTAKDTIIIEEGDILLVLRDSDAHGRLLVSSVVLKHTSPVFKVMLGPNFAEGQLARSADSQNPAEIQCPDDSWEGMHMLCTFLHNCKSELDAPIPTAQIIERFAEATLLADKYACTDAITLQAQAVFAKFSDRWTTNLTQVTTRVLRDLATAAYVLEYNGYFYVFTKRMVLDRSKTPYSDLHSFGSEGIRSVLGIIFLLKLEEQRGAARSRLNEGMPEFAKFVCNAFGCSATLQSAEFLTNLKNATGVSTEWPPTFSTTTLRNVLVKIRNAGNVKLGKIDNCSHHTEITRGADEFKTFASTINKEMAGMCRLCVEAGYFTPGPCAVEGHWKPCRGFEDLL